MNSERQQSGCICVIFKKKRCYPYQNDNPMADLNIFVCGVLGESEHLIKEQNIASRE